MDRGAVAPVVAPVEGQPAHGLGPFEDLEHLDQGRPAGPIVVQHVEAGGDDRLFDVGHRGLAVQGHEGRHHGHPPAVGVGHQLAAGLPVSRLAAAMRRTGVEGVEGPLAPAELDDVAAQGERQVDVVGLGVPGDDRLDAVGGQAGGDPRARAWTCRGRGGP